MPSPHFTSESPRSIQFKAIRNRTDLANWIGISERTLLYVLYRLPDELKYSTFEISKRGGGKRVISAPNKALKYSQKKISEVLYEVLPPRKIAKGYVPGAGVYDHAEMHKRRSTVVTADIKSFFPSINFGRVRGMFMSPPFALPASVSTMLAQLCCKGGELPQGSPTSPAISNIICRSLDLDLLRFSKNHRISVSRYADDICFSTNNRKPIFSLVASDPQLGTFPGNEISEIFRSNGFTLNLSKFHLSRSTGRQMVTGLIVNDGVNLPRSWRRQLRVILHVRSRMDDKASTEILNSWVSPPASRRGTNPSADALIKGKASFATYVDRRSGRKFTESLHRSYPKLRAILPRTTPRFPVRIITEGPTDLVHLRAAIEHFSDRLDLSDTLLKFNNYQGDQGDVETLHTLRRIANVDVDELTIGIFDFDNPKLLKSLSIGEGEHVRLGRMVFAACLSRPQNVNGQYCIESLYRRSQAVQTTIEGRRLFFSDEFGDDGRMIQGTFAREFPRKSAVVLSERVFDPNNPESSLTLSKTSFASMIEAGTAPFSDMDFSGFLPTLLHLRKMIDEAIMFQRYK